MKAPAHNQQELQQRNRLGTVGRKTILGFNQFYARETSTLSPDASPKSRQIKKK